MPKFQSAAYYDEKTVQKIADNTVVAYPSKRGRSKKPRNGPVVVTHWYDGIDPYYSHMCASTRSTGAESRSSAPQRSSFTKGVNHVATVDGVTVAEADRIEKKHISALAVVDGNLVLTRENLATIQTPLPAADGFTPLWSILAPTETTLGRTVHTGGASAGTSSLIPNLWIGYDAGGSYSDPIPFIDDDSSYGWAWIDAGWYITQVTIDCRFVPAVSAPTALPDSMQIDLTTYGGANLQTRFPVVSPKGNVAGAKTDCTASAVVGPYYQPSWADMLALGRNQKDAHQLFFRWNGNAQITHPSAGSSVIAPGIEVYSTRIA